MEPEDFSGIIFILELKGHVGHRQRIFPLYFVHCRLQFLTGKKLKVLTGAQTLSHPSFQVVAGPVVIKQRTQRFCFTTICFILVTNLNQMAYIITYQIHHRGSCQEGSSERRSEKLYETLLPSS